MIDASKAGASAALLEIFDVRYHVPRSQVWEGSRGGQRGNLHLYATEEVTLGRITRRRGQTLCGRTAWWAREPDGHDLFDENDICPRCREIGARALPEEVTNA